MPGFEDALAAGDVSAGHVDAISNAVKGMDAPTLAEFNAHAESLLDDATKNSVDTFARNARDLARFIKTTRPGASETDELEAQRKASKVTEWVDKQSGMYKTL